LKDCFRLFPVCPSSYPNNGLIDANGKISIELSTAMGARHLGTFSMRTGALLIQALKHEGFWEMQYMEDFNGVEPEETASKAAQSMDEKLELVNLKQNPDKQVHPTTKATVLGIEVDTVSMEVRLPLGRIQRIETLLAKDWESGANPG
jgi:hypothetical protein